MQVDEWWRCYDEGLQGWILAAAFAHPAKVSLGLAKRIYRHALEEQWVAVGSLCLDTMAGIATFGLVAATYGIRWLGVELEERFCAWGQGNIALHTREWLALGKPVPVLVQGDARELREVMAGVQGDCVVSSPPYANSVDSQGCGIDWSRMGPATRKRKRGPGTKHYETVMAQLSYQSPSKLRALGAPEHEIHRAIHRQDLQRDGTNHAQLGAMREGSFAAVITSPPFSQTVASDWHVDSSPGRLDKLYENYQRQDGGMTREQFQVHCERRQPGYGQSSGQLGQMTTLTYWSEMAKVYAACYDVLPIGGHIILVVKGFVRRGVYQDLPTQTAQLLEHVGFTMLHYHRAMLSSPVGQARLFDNGEDRTSRKSFFRRLAEKKGAPVIDHEAVLCGVKA